MADGGDEVEAGYPEQFLKVYKKSIMASATAYCEIYLYTIMAVAITSVVKLV